MKYTKPGNSDLNVSRICMGCMDFGDAANGQHSRTIDEEQDEVIIRRVAQTAEKHGVSMTEVSLSGDRLDGGISKEKQIEWIDGLK